MARPGVFPGMRMLLMQYTTPTMAATRLMNPPNGMRGTNWTMSPPMTHQKPILPSRRASASTGSSATATVRVSASGSTYRSGTSPVRGSAPQRGQPAVSAVTSSPQ